MSVTRYFELHNRLLQLAFSFVLLILGAVVCASALISTPISELGIGLALFLLAAVPLANVVVLGSRAPTSLQALEFKLVDERGTVRVWMKEHGIACYDENGQVKAAMDANGLVLFDEMDTPRTWIHTDGIVYFDVNGKQINSFGKHPKVDC